MSAAVSAVRRCLSTCAAADGVVDVQLQQAAPDLASIQLAEVRTAAPVAAAVGAAAPEAAAETKAPEETVAAAAAPASTPQRPPHFGPEALLESIECGAIGAVRGRWYAAQAASGKPLPRRQDLPPEAFFPVAELRRLVEALGEDWGFLFVALSYRWLTKDHPDPENFHLNIVAKVARLYLDGGPGSLVKGAQGSPLAAAFKKAGLGEENADFAFFQDYPCLFQKPRSPEEDALFKQGLSMLHVWYGHEQNVCWQQTELPAGFAAEMEALGLARSYEESGWCFVEAAVSAGVKVGTRRLDLGKRTDDAMTTYGGRGIAFPHWKLEVVCAAKRQPPLLPDEVRQLLETEKKFTTGKEDVEVVDALYRGFFEGVAGAATVLTFKGLQWGAAEVKALAGVLPRFSVLQTLDLSDNKLGGEGASELAGWLRGGASLTSLILSHNNIKGSGEALGEALKANTSLKKLEMSNCGLDAEDGKGLAGGLAVHAPLTSLSVRGNNIKGSGAAFGEALKVNSSLKELNMRACSLEADDGKGLAGGLAIHASLTELNLMENKLCSLGDIGRGTYDATGITALAGALGVCVSLTSISLLGNKFDDEAALMLLTIKEEKLMLLTLCGLKPEQTEANFYGLDMGPAEAKLLAPELAVHPSLRSVSLAANQLCGLDNLGRGTYDATGIKALTDALSVTASLTSVSLVGNQLCGLDVRGRGTYDATGIKALADALSVTASLTSLKVGDNRLGDEGKAALRKAVEGKEGFELLM